MTFMALSHFWLCGPLPQLKKKIIEILKIFMKNYIYKCSRKDEYTYIIYQNILFDQKVHFSSDFKINEDFLWTLKCIGGPWTLCLLHIPK